MRYAYRITPDSFEKLPREVLGSFNRQRFDDVVSGHYDGFSFELYEASLSHKSGESDDSVFRGVIVAFDIVTPFPGLLVATRKRGQVSRFFGGIFGGGLEQLECGVTALDAVYDFRTDNLDAARPLVTGHLAQALKWLGETWPEEQALVALKGGDGFLLLPRTDDFFELPPTSTQLDYRTHIEPIVADMAAILATAALVRRIGAEEQQ
jgi:hypothetical protein